MAEISVIIPIYKVEEYLSTCIDSVLKQSFQDFEIILVDDCSPDASADIAKSYMAQDTRVRYYLHERNIGLGATRNTGISHAKGTYIFFLDSDDFLHKDALKVLHEKMKIHDVDIVIGGNKPVEDRDYRPEDIQSLSQSQREDTHHIYKKDTYIDGTSAILARFGYMISHGGIPPAVWNRLYKKSLFDNPEVSFLERGYAQDVGTTPRILLHTNSVLLIKENYYYYRIRDTAATSDISLAHKQTYVKDVINAVLSIRDFFVKTAHFEQYKSILQRVYYSNVENAVFQDRFPKDIQLALYQIFLSHLKEEIVHPHSLVDFTTMYRGQKQLMQYPDIPSDTLKRWIWFASLSKRKKLVSLLRWAILLPLKKLLRR